MSAVIRNNAGEDRYVPLAGRVVPDGETFELADEEFDLYEFGPDFKVVSEPRRRPAPKTPAPIEGTDKKES